MDVEDQKDSSNNQPDNKRIYSGFLNAALIKGPQFYDY